MLQNGLFKALKANYPQFRNLSSNHFSKLDRRTEMYPIIKQLRADFPNKPGLEGYSNKTSLEISRMLYKFVKNNF